MRSGKEKRTLLKCPYFRTHRHSEGSEESGWTMEKPPNKIAGRELM